MIGLAPKDFYKTRRKLFYVFFGSYFGRVWLGKLKREENIEGRVVSFSRGELSERVW